MNNRFFAISIDTLLKTFSAIDAGESISFQVAPDERPDVSVGDCVLGFIGQGVDEFRTAFSVTDVDDDLLVFSKTIERLEGVPIAGYVTSLLPQSLALASPGSVVEMPTEIAKSIFLELKNGGKEENDSGCQSKKDLLTSALQVFKSLRGDSGWSDGYHEANKGTRDYYAKLSAGIDTLDVVKVEEMFLGVRDDKGNVTFQPMWSGSNGTGWAHIKRGLDKSPQVTIDAIKRYHDDASVICAFTQKGFMRPSGFGDSVVSELLMKFHPDAAIKCGTKTIKVLKKLNLMSFKRDDAYDEWEYRQVLGIAADIKLRMDRLGITRMLDDNEKADYLTVNEFIAWCNENEDLIKEKMMNMQMKKDKPTKFDEAKRKPLKFEGKDDELLLRLLASLRAKPFAILAGHSGTGKSRYVKKLAYMMCNANELRHEGQLPGNFLLLQVKPNWHDSTDLLGFRNAMDDGRYQKTPLIEFMFRAYHNPETPFFLCLDEMNLAPVEQYFAEFLSAMESEEPVPLNDISENDNNLLELGCEWLDSCEYLKTKKFSIPKNLFIVGTVNMDETTNQFSRKVLDRAFTIEMTDVDFRTFDGEHDAPPSYKDTIEETKIKELLNGEFAAEKLDDDDRDEGSALIGVQKKLEQTPFAIAYRFASEYTLLKRALKVFDAGETKIGLDALDQAVLMKILPRIAGESDYIKKIYGEKEDDGLRGALKGKTASLKKIGEILDRAKETGAQYITFWP